MIKDYNRFEVKYGEVFKFMFLSEPFIIVNSVDTDLFLNLKDFNLYSFDHIEDNFYRKEDDEGFLGVNVIASNLKDYFKED